VRTFDKQFTLATTAGYDDVTGRGTPNDSFLGAIAAATRKVRCDSKARKGRPPAALPALRLTAGT